MTTKKYVSRGFLNKEKGMAAFQADVTKWGEEASAGEFTISDYNRQVTLDFLYSNKTERELHRYKLDKLIEELTKFRKELFD